MEILFDPAVWVGLLTLIVLEIVLGIDNLVFIAILAKKLPKSQQDKALYVGLGLALIMRLGLLSVMSWLVTLTQPLFHVWEHPFSARDLILIVGGLFLLYKATTELHERLEAIPATESNHASSASFWGVIAQIIVLDAVFSLDSIITAVGIADDLPVMMTAVIVAVFVMIFASKSLTNFVNSHPTVVVLCLSFLLMIGLSLVADGFGFHIPKGYLYAAIGFSILIEFFNQVAMRNSEKQLARIPFRERTTMAIVRLMSKRGEVEAEDQTRSESIAPDAEPFDKDECRMVEGVLTLADRSIKTIMTPRGDVAWIDVEKSIEEIRSDAVQMSHSLYPVCSGSLENVVGYVKAKDLISRMHTKESIIELARERQPLMVPETINIIRLIRSIKQTRAHMVFVTDEFGVFQGLVTSHDVLEAIAGDFPDEGDEAAIAVDGDGWIAEGMTDLHVVEQTTGVEHLLPKDESFVTIAGLLLDRLGRLPAEGEKLEESGLVFEVLEVENHRILSVRITRVQPEAVKSE